MTEYTPTTAEVRALYVTGTPPHSVSVEQGNAEFDHWLSTEVAAAERRGAVKALREAATEGYRTYVDTDAEDGIDYESCVWLLGRADLIEQGAE